MKLFKVTFFLCLLTLLLSSSTMMADSPVKSYDVVEIYEEVELEDGCKFLDALGNLKEIRTIYVPTHMNVGKHEVELTEVEYDLYHICGTDLYIEMPRCYEYVMYKDAILNITSNYGHPKGEVIFID